jgi:hypothetical protein
MLRADEVATSIHEQRFAQLELPPPAQAPVSGPVFMAPSAYGPDAVIVTAPPQPAAAAGEDPICPDLTYRTSAWNFALDLIPTRSHFTEDEFGGWPEDSNLGVRFELGYEDARGVGMRARLWVFAQDVSTPAIPFDFGAGTLSWDFYKRLFIDDSELVVGGGPVAGVMLFDFSLLDEETQFSGGGVTVFAEGFVPTLRFKKTDIGMVFRARLSLLEGEWDETVVPFIMETEHETFEVWEAAWGLELRHRFGWRQDKHFYVRLVPEFQRWDSSWLGAFTGSAVAFVGTDITLGLAW